MKELTRKILNRAIMSTGKPIKKVKVTSEFYNYLTATCLTTFQTAPTLPLGVVGQFTGIPIEIDNSIEDERYRIIYEENYL